MMIIVFFLEQSQKSGKTEQNGLNKQIAFPSTIEELQSSKWMNHSNYETRKSERHCSSVVKFSLRVWKVPGLKTQQGQKISSYMCCNSQQIA